MTSSIIPYLVPAFCFGCIITDVLRRRRIKAVGVRTHRRKNGKGFGVIICPVWYECPRPDWLPYEWVWIGYSWNVAIAPDGRAYYVETRGSAVGLCPLVETKGEPLGGEAIDARLFFNVSADARIMDALSQSLPELSLLLGKDCLSQQ